jgi:hypothetical protein
MTIVHIHIERTGGVSLQGLYSKKYPYPKMFWYSVRDDSFAPLTIKTSGAVRDFKLKIYAAISRLFPKLRHALIYLRTWLRKREMVPPEDLNIHAEIVNGHFTVDKLLAYLPPDKHEYRTIVRDPLARTWSHFQVHKGDVGYEIYGNKVAFISSGSENYAFVIESKELVQTLRNQFDFFWKISKKYS